MIDLPDLSSNSDSYDLGLYLTLLQLKGFKIEDVFYMCSGSQVK